MTHIIIIIIIINMRIVQTEVPYEKIGGNNNNNTDLDSGST